MFSKRANDSNICTAVQTYEHTYKQVSSLCQKGNVGKASQRLTQSGLYMHDCKTSYAPNISVPEFKIYVCMLSQGSMPGSSKEC